MAKFWFKKKVLVTGGAGFIGSHLVELLVEKGAEVTVADNLENGSLDNLEKVRGEIRFLKKELTILREARDACQGQEIVFNLAARVGGIEYNWKHLGTMFRDNILINTLVLEAARQERVKRFLVVSSACVYPRFCTVPTPEEEGFNGVPEPTNEGYGWAKRMAEVQGRMYAKEFGMNIGIVRPYNAYGPRDHLNPKKSHVIPALIKRVFDGEDPLIVWGSGRQTRAFLYVSDLVQGMMMAIEKYPKPDPINLGANEEMTIKDLVNLIVKLSGKNPRIVFDASKLEGQPRRNCDTRKAREKIGFIAKTSLKEGLQRTISWYESK